jgi:hypothetical protein
MKAKDASDSLIAFHLFGRAGPHGGGGGGVVSRVSGCSNGRASPPTLPIWVSIISLY